MAGGRPEAPAAAAAELPRVSVARYVWPYAPSPMNEWQCSGVAATAGQLKKNDFVKRTRGVLPRGSARIGVSVARTFAQALRADGRLRRVEGGVECDIVGGG